MDDGFSEGKVWFRAVLRGSFADSYAPPERLSVAVCRTSCGNAPVENAIA